MAESVKVNPSWYSARGFGKYDTSCPKCGWSRVLQMAPDATEEMTIDALSELKKELDSHECLAKK